jgi:hypothetical protein
MGRGTAPAADAGRPCAPRLCGPRLAGHAGRRPSPPGAHAARPVHPADPRGSPPGAVRAAVPGAAPRPHPTAGAPHATGAERADPSRPPWGGTLRSHGGGETALAPAGPVDRAPPRRVPGPARAASEVAPVAHPTTACGVRSRATAPSHARSRPLLTPARRRGGKRRAGTLHEPCARADGGRATPPDLLRLYSRWGHVPSGSRITPWQGNGTQPTARESQRDGLHEAAFTESRML